ncbi:hypothetical protein OXPF_41350 [Oxobacter pfennigii]|uniref:Uncharacterized protein n=1 Tax=Oxobacter pfennigii TaxID=36849 RepID=A0A0P8YRW3_9CLOT|nr:hypothetical protein [Oxobacter pfennigii]KPU42350.1 hypothetical protein OXPF_41350 [Oxobacter pfennigii]
MKRVLYFIACILITLNIVPARAFAIDDDGKIDLYEVFSNKEDMLKSEVGSQVYKWSMYLPDDGIIYKSDNANFFYMSTASYQSEILLEVSKNEERLSLEDMLYKLENSSRKDNYPVWGDRELYVDIVSDNSGQRYIKIIKTNTFYDYYTVEGSGNEFSDYVENRIYIENDYIYNLSVLMTGDFYKSHEDMFDKLINSFKPSYDNNTYIKELSDRVSTKREYINSIYGWKISLNPYWRAQGIENGRNQNFRALYTDEELSNEVKAENIDNSVIQEGISVSLISSADIGESAKEWAALEIERLKDNYDSNVYKILKYNRENRRNMDAWRVTVTFNTMTNNSYVKDNLYIIGNGYKYLVSATIKEDKYKDSAKKSNIETMLESFELDSNYLSKYLGRIASSESFYNFDSVKELRTKKYDFATQITKAFDVSKGGSEYETGGTNDEDKVSAYEPISHIKIDMTAGFYGNEIKNTVLNYTGKYSIDGDIAAGLAHVKIKSAEVKGAVIYKIQKEYDINAVKALSGPAFNKVHNLESLLNEYIYIIKAGNDTFIQSVTIPAANGTGKNKDRIQKLQSDITIRGINYNTDEWTEHEISGF